MWTKIMAQFSTANCCELTSGLFVSSTFKTIVSVINIMSKLATRLYIIQFLQAGKLS